MAPQKYVLSHHSTSGQQYLNLFDRFLSSFAASLIHVFTNIEVGFIVEFIMGSLRFSETIAFFNRS